MSRSNYVALAALMALGIGAGVPTTQAQVTVSVGPPPVCPYGYYDFAPYACAPYGYYGPDWFANGVFIGVGPWYHGPAAFNGHVNNRFDPHHGYHGPMPARGERPAHDVVNMRDFHGNEVRDGRGHVGR
jgi:hypothetical protein